MLNKLGVNAKIDEKGTRVCHSNNLTVCWELAFDPEGKSIMIVMERKMHQGWKIHAELT